MRLNEWINIKLFQSVSSRLESKNQHSLKSQQSIKLSVITQFFPPDYAATGQLIEELVRHLGSLGIDIEVFRSQPGYAFRTPNTPAVERVGRVRIQRSRTAQLWPGRIRGKAVNGVLYTLRAALHLFRARHGNNVLLMTTAPPFLPLVGYLAYLLFKIPYICILYDLYPDIAIALGVIPKHHWLARLWQALNKKIWRNAKAIIVLSPAMKLQVAANCSQIADKISVIHSWADPGSIVPIAKQENWFAWKYNLVVWQVNFAGFMVRKSSSFLPLLPLLPLPPMPALTRHFCLGRVLVKKFTVLYSGNLGRCHEMNTILEAAKQLQDEPIQFVCIGGGAKRDSLIEQVNQLGLNNFMFLPYQDKQVLPYSLTACDLSLVSVDECTENLVTPSKLYSALASGRPIAVICSQYSYLRQLIAEADCGSTFENGDANGLAQFIRLLNRDRQLAERMGKAGRQYLRSHFTPKIISKQYLDVLARAILSSDVRSMSQNLTE